MLASFGVWEKGRFMKAMAIFTATAAILALSACDRLGIGGATSNESANASTNASDANKDGGGGNAQADADGSKDPAAGGGAIPAAAGGVNLDRAYVMGRWTDDGDCSAAVEFTEDGRFVASNGNEGLWHLAGDRLTMQGERALVLQIVPIDQNTMNVVNPDGSLGRSTRC
jgi:hypothetical protein